MKYAIIFFFILKLSLAVASDCESVFSSAGEVFISFAKENRGEGKGAFFFSSEFANKWTVSSAKEFLKDLQNRIGISATLKILERPYPFRLMSYVDFKERATFYEEYIGKESVNEILLQNQKGLLAFNPRNPVQEMRAFFDYILLYFGKESAMPVIQEIIRSGALIYDPARKLIMFKEAIEELENIGYGKSAIRSIFLSNNISLSRAMLLIDRDMYGIAHGLFRHMPVKSPQLFGPFFSSIVLPGDPGSYW